MQVRAFAGLAALVIVACAGRAEGARVLDHYDVDSLVYLSSAIVRAEVGTSETFETADGMCVVMRVKVLEAFKGEVAGEVRVTGLEEYHRRGPGGAWVAPQAGDVVYLFLVPNGRMGYAKYRRVEAEYTVIESGARLAMGERVVGFAQYTPRLVPGEMPARMPPGGFVTMMGDLFEGAPEWTRAGFEARLKGAIEGHAAVARLIEGKATAETVAAAAKLLQERTVVLKEERATTDWIGALLVEKVLQESPPALLMEIRPGLPRNTQIRVDWALQKRAGRAYLLERVADGAEPMARRLEMARILAGAGHTYAVESREANWLGPKDYWRRLAGLAVAEGETPLGEVLLRGLVSGGASGPEEDQNAAGAILAEAMVKAEGLKQFLLAEALMQMDYAQYRQALPRAGSMLTLVEPGEGFVEGLKAGQVAVKARFRNRYPQGTPAGEVKLVVQRVGGDGGEVEMAVDSKLASMPANFGRDFRLMGRLPGALAAGRYRVFLRVSIMGRQEEGLGFEVAVER